MPDNLRCSFCAKASDDVAKLIAGPGVFICNECVGLCAEILESQLAAPRVPIRDSMTDDQILEHLPRVTAVQKQVDDDLHEWVACLRSRDVSWERIGTALGMTRQSAWERFK